MWGGRVTRTWNVGRINHCVCDSEKCVLEYWQAGTTQTVGQSSSHHLVTTSCSTTDRDEVRHWQQVAVKSQLKAPNAPSDFVVTCPSSSHQPVSCHLSQEFRSQTYNPAVKSTEKYYKLTISDVDYHHQRSGHKESHKAISFWYKTHCCVARSRWTTSHQIFEKYFSHFAPKYFLVWISKYCAREMIFNQSKVCVFCKSEEAEFKESWTRNGDHYCTLFFRTLRFLRTRHYPKYFPTKTIRQNCPNFNFQ